VPESTVKLTIGHKRASLTFGHYSRGERVKLRKHTNKLSYTDDVMRLIRGKAAKPKRGGRKRAKRK
jgi:hypothetical protein